MVMQTGQVVGLFLKIRMNNDDLIDPTEEVIRVYNAIDSIIEIRWGGGTRLSFTSAGVPVASGEFSMCTSTSRAIEERVVNVTSTGLITKQVRGACP
ncbi:GspH/FimT family protein [Endozoicomonas ascidiicola]|uniref:GspH/FimT family protein n=1 Tax=Endozoicomonas ascidiicola TaxID=1698521 RepID=UPI00082CA544|nr:GspH/FimT family protein [Endozoicomonas ascidiicola]